MLKSFKVSNKISESFNTSELEFAESFIQYKRGWRLLIAGFGYIAHVSCDPEQEYGSGYISPEGLMIEVSSPSEEWDDLDTSLILHEEERYWSNTKPSDHEGAERFGNAVLDGVLAVKDKINEEFFKAVKN